MFILRNAPAFFYTTGGGGLVIFCGTFSMFTVYCFLLIMFVLWHLYTHKSELPLSFSVLHIVLIGIYTTSLYLFPLLSLSLYSSHVACGSQAFFRTPKKEVGIFFSFYFYHFSIYYHEMTATRNGYASGRLSFFVASR